MKRHLILIGFIILSLISYSQTGNTAEEDFGKQVFLPSIEMGYLNNQAKHLSGGLVLKTSIEYRIRNNNDVFFRLNYDTYDSKYKLENINSLTNIVKGVASFSDLLLGAGYRFGDAKVRSFVALQSGVKFYNFPIAHQTGSITNIELNSRNLFTTRVALGAEYYMNEKSAFTLEIFQNQVWNKQDFWLDSGNIYGVSVGFITALF